MDLQQGFGINRMGTESRLQRGNFGQLMSALGHKRTLKRVHLMSALPPEADIYRRQLVPRCEVTFNTGD
jgi:hypothetical protein